MQTYARLCEENKLEELEEKGNNFVDKGASLKDHIRRMGKRIKIIF